MEIHLSRLCTSTLDWLTGNLGGERAKTPSSSRVEGDDEGVGRGALLDPEALPLRRRFVRGRCILGFRGLGFRVYGLGRPAAAWAPGRWQSGRPRIEGFRV